jgi:hypothetical protein
MNYKNIIFIDGSGNTVTVGARNVGTANPKWPIQITVQKICNGKRDPKKLRTQFFTLDIPTEKAAEFIGAITEKWKP